MNFEINFFKMKDFLSKFDMINPGFILKKIHLLGNLLSKFFDKAKENSFDKA